MIDFLIVTIVVAIVGGASAHIYKAKKNGAKCIGCPDAKSCSGKCSSCGCNCGHH